MNMKKQILISLISLSSILTVNAQWTGSNPVSTTGSIALGSGSVNGNTTKVYIQNPAGKTWAISSGGNMNNQTNFSIYNWTDHSLETTPLPYLNITQEGNVGIGLHTPGSKLDVNGEIAIGSGSVNANTTKMYIRNTSGKTWAISSGGNMNNQTNFSIYNWTDHSSETTPLPYFNITQEGNVGIGLHTPTTKLDVAGTIRAYEVKVCLSQGCDFVFKSDYKLMNLRKLEEFVKTNQHLPEIASEKEMTENGVNMKDMQMKLLQKIEELTLYTIEQNKNLEQQNAKIVELEKQNAKIHTLEEKIEKLESALK